HWEPKNTRYTFARPVVTPIPPTPPPYLRGTADGAWAAGEAVAAPGCCRAQAAMRAAAARVGTAPCRAGGGEAGPEGVVTGGVPATAAGIVVARAVLAAASVPALASRTPALASGTTAATPRADHRRAWVPSLIFFPS